MYVYIHIYIYVNTHIYIYIHICIYNALSKHLYGQKDQKPSILLQFRILSKLKARYIVASLPPTLVFHLHDRNGRRIDRIHLGRGEFLVSLKMEFRWRIPLRKGYVFVIALNGPTDSVFIRFTDPSPGWLTDSWAAWADWKIESFIQQMNKGVKEGIPHSGNWRGEAKMEEKCKRIWTNPRIKNEENSMKKQQQQQQQQQQQRRTKIWVNECD